MAIFKGIYRKSVAGGLQRGPKLWMDEREAPIFLFRFIFSFWLCSEVISNLQKSCKNKTWGMGGEREDQGSCYPAGGEGVQGAGVTSQETTLSSPHPWGLGLGPTGRSDPCHPLNFTLWHLPLQTPISVTLSSCHLPGVFIARAFRSSLVCLIPPPPHPPLPSL